MKKSFLVFMLAASAILTGCTGPGEAFEPRTYGVRNSIWNNLTHRQQMEAMEKFKLEQEIIAQQEKARAQREKAAAQRHSSLTHSSSLFFGSFHIHFTPDFGKIRLAKGEYYKYMNKRKWVHSSYRVSC